MKKASSIILSLVVVGLFFASSICMGAPKYGGTLIMSTNQEIAQLDPHKQADCATPAVFHLVCENLFDMDKNYGAKPSLAESWDISEDGKTWTIHVRKGVKWHNGRDLTAEDIKWNIDRILDPETGAGQRSRLEVIDSVMIVDSHTINLVLKYPYTALPKAFSGACTVIHFFAPESLNEDGTVNHVIGTGPFMWVERKLNEYVKLRKNPHYWQKGLPYLDEIILKPIPDSRTAYNALKARNLDIAMELPIEEARVDIKKPQKGYRLNVTKWGTVRVLNINVNKPPFNNARVRQAMDYGINREEINLGVNDGGGFVINQPFAPDFQWYCDFPVHGQDIEKAKALLKEAGYPNGLDVTMLTAQSPTELKQAEVVQMQLKQIGMNVNVQISDWPTLSKKLRESEFEFTSDYWGVLSDPDVVMLPLFHSQGNYKMYTGGGYNNPDFDEWYDRARMALSLEERKEAYCEAVKIFLDQVPAIWTVTTPNYSGWRDYVKGWEPHANMYHLHYSGGGLAHTWLDK